MKHNNKTVEISKKKESNLYLLQLNMSLTEDISILRESITETQALINSKRQGQSSSAIESLSSSQSDSSATKLVPPTPMRTRVESNLSQALTPSRSIPIEESNSGRYFDVLMTPALGTANQSLIIY